MQNISEGHRADPAGIDWEDAFSNADYIPDGATYPERWAARAATFRRTAKADIDLPYGDHPRHVFDLFWPSVAPKGLVVFVHGGYWRAFDKSLWSDLAAGAVASGWAVALPSYSLALTATLPEITAQIAQAITVAAGRVAGPIHLAGHSAGGHLATRMACEGGPLPEAVASRLARVVSIAGLHDLRPLLCHSMNKELGLTKATAQSESPALCQPRRDVAVTAWVGADERPEFLRQSAVLAEAWRRAGAQTGLTVEPGRHHFDVIDGLRESNHALCRALVGNASAGS